MLRSNKGFTLVELIVAVAIVSIMMLIIYAFFVGQTRMIENQQHIIEMQDNARFAMDFITRDIRNAGFLTDPSAALRIEDDCGNAGNNVQYDVATGTFTVGGTPNVIAGGDIVETTILDGCPNGSDRISLIQQPQDTLVGPCTPNGDCVKQKGKSHLLNFPCKDTVNTSTGDCQATLDILDLGLDCATSDPEPNPIVFMCNVTQSNLCASAYIDTFTCNAQRSGLRVIEFSISKSQTGLDPFTGSDWDRFGTGGGGSSSSGGSGSSGKKKAKDSVAFSGYRYRTYQLLDLDSDGSTELVFSDNVMGAMLIPGTGPIDPQWTPVAFHIDDLQIAYSTLATPNTFENGGDVWEVSGCSGLTPPDVCLPDLVSAVPPETPVAIRVSIIARSTKRESAGTTDTSDMLDLYRGTLENNTPGPTVYDPSTATAGQAACFGTEVCGCGIAVYGPPSVGYQNCTQNGNAQGFRRRTMSQTVRLRNLAGLSFN